MQSSDNTSPACNTPLSTWDWVGVFFSCAWIFWFFCFSKNYTCHSAELYSAVGWWLQGKPFSSGFSEMSLVPFVSLYLLYHTWTKRRELSPRISPFGICGLFFGGLLAIAAVRTHQPRIAIAAFSTMLTGVVWYYWGWRFALRCAFPLYLLLLPVVPPTLEQSTVGLQILSTKLAHWGADLCGVETIVEGTNISSVSGKWDTFNIAGGCSGLNSLKTLLLISLPWAFLADNLKLWKRLVLIACSVPIAVISNAFRITSIFVLAEYVNPLFAGKTWHDWSGLALFFPASLLILFFVHSLLTGELLFLKRRKTVIRNSSNLHAQNH